MLQADVHVRTPSDTTTEALCRIGELYGIEAGIRGKSAAERRVTMPSPGAMRALPTGLASILSRIAKSPVSAAKTAW